MSQDCETLSARDGNVETVIVEEEIDTARRLLPRRARHGVEHDRRLLTLEAVDSSDANAVRERLGAEKPKRLRLGVDRTGTFPSVEWW